MRTGYIYSLADPKTGEVRYVGMTVRTLKKRLLRHIWDANNTASQRHVHYWIKSLDGAVPLIAELEAVEFEDKAELGDRERHWISVYRNSGSDLCNLTDGGDGQIGYVHRQETRDSMSTTHRTYRRVQAWYDSHPEEKEKRKQQLRAAHVAYLARRAEAKSKES